jgi:hypothetical protein
MIRPRTGSSRINSTQMIFIPVSAPLLSTLMMAQAVERGTHGDAPEEWYALLG